MRILRITSLKTKANNKWFIVLKCTCISLQKIISELHGAKSKPKVAPVLKIIGTFYKQANSMCFVNKQSVMHILGGL